MLSRESSALSSLRRPSQTRQAAVFAVPTYLVVLILVAVPLVYLVYASLQTASPGAPNAEFTLANIIAFFTEDRFFGALGNSLWLGFLVSLAATVVGVGMAWLVARTDVPFNRALTALVPLPIFLSPFAVGIAWFLLGSENSGLINTTLRLILGAEAGIVNIMSFGGLLFVMTLAFAPLAYLFTLGPMTNMDGSLEEASRIQGASLTRTFFRITAPVIAPGILSAFLMIFVLAAEMFSLPGLIGVAIGFRTLPYYIYQSTTSSPPDWGGAAAAGLALLVVMLAGVVLQNRALRASSRFVTISGKGARPVTVHLGRWRWCSLVLPVGYVLLAVVLPAIALVLVSFLRYFTPDITPDLFTLENWRAALGSSRFEDALTNTIIVGSLTPTVAVVIAFAVAYVRHRTVMPLRSLAEMVGMTPVAIPGIVFGVGVLWAYVRSPIYGTIWLFAIAYCARFLPHALRTISSGLVQIDKGLEEASRLAGAGPVRTAARITIPLLGTSAISSWLLLVIYCTRELNVAIMTYSSRSVVLPVVMWNEMSSGLYQRAAIIAIIESALILSIVALAALVLRIDLRGGAARQSAKRGGK